MKNFVILYGIYIVLGIVAIVAVGYPGDGKKGVPAVFSRIER